MNAVLVYEDSIVAGTAKAMLEHAAQAMGEPAHWSIKPWCLDMLQLPPVAEAALAEAAEAHLIVLAMRQAQSVLPWLVDWLEQWARCRQVREAALAVWDVGNGETGSARATPELSRFAGRHGLSLLFDDNAPVEHESSMFGSDLHEREVSMTPTLEHILEQPVRRDYQHWGINE